MHADIIRRVIDLRRELRASIQEDLRRLIHQNNGAHNATIDAVILLLRNGDILTKDEYRFLVHLGYADLADKCDLFFEVGSIG
jgi:hypothetical protein